MLLPIVTNDLVGLVTNVASNIWSAHFQNFRSVTVTGSTSMAKILIFLSLWSIHAAAIENLKNKSQAFFMKLTYVLIIVSNHILNSFGVRPFYLAFPQIHTVPLQALATLVLSSLSCQWYPTWYDGFFLG